MPLLTDANHTEVTECSLSSGGSFKASNSCKLELKCLPLNALNTFRGLRLPGAAQGIGLPKSDACKGVALGPHPHSYPETLSSSLCPGGNHTSLPQSAVLKPCIFSVNIFYVMGGKLWWKHSQKAAKEIGSTQCCTLAWKQLLGPRAPPCSHAHLHPHPTTTGSNGPGSPIPMGHSDRRGASLCWEPIPNPSWAQGWAQYLRVRTVRVAGTAGCCA